MPNQLALNGAQPQKQTRFSPIYTGRWSSGLWTNRSPLRDANTNRLTEKFYGPAGDALIAGLNVEITNRLTLARRPGNSVFDSNSYSSVDRFEEFRMFGPNIEQINVMIDQANALYSLFNGVKSLVWTKSSGASQSYMQSVGNSLYFGNGIDNKKWLQSLHTWGAAARWGTPTTPFMETFIIDPNGNIQQLTDCVIHVTQVQVAANVLTVTSSDTLTSVLSKTLQVVFPGGMAASFLDGQTVTITSVSANSFTAAFTHANYGPTAETGIIATVLSGGTPISGGSQPTWSTQVPSSSNNFTGGITIDGTVQWTNRGTPVENWGIQGPTTAPTVTVGSSRSAWAKNTFYSLAGITIDPNGNVQQVTTPGLSGSSAPTWATVVGNTTTDGTVVWTMLQTAASLTWAAGTHYAAGAFIVGNASGQNCLFQLQPKVVPYLNGTISVVGWNSTSSGSFNKVYPAPAGDFTFTSPSLDWAGNTGQNTQMKVKDGAGHTTGTTDTGHYENWEAAITGTLHVPVAGQYSIQLNHDDGAFMAFGGAAQKISGGFFDPLNHTQTAVLGLTQMFGQNNSGSQQVTAVWNFPTAGDYPFEINWTNWEHASLMNVLINNKQIANLTSQQDISGPTQPIWPAWSTSYAPNYPTVSEYSTGTTDGANLYTWQNLGPVADYTWQAKINFTLADTTIIDSNGNTESPYRTGITGTTEPTFATGLNQLTNDNPNLIWLNIGQASAPSPGTVSTFNGGWVYAIALVNTLDDTVSNCGQVSPATGNFIGASGVSLAAGSGLPDPSQIDPQADYVAIFRSTDGQPTPFLIPGNGNSIYTIPLSQYLQNGYTDTATDEQLNNELEGPIGEECTAPPAGAINLTYHLNRIFFSVGNTVYWTSGPDVPIGNGVNGVGPLNFDEFPSLVKRIVPLSIGAIVFTVSDVFLISGQGTTSSPIQKGTPYLKGIGLLNYNALDVNGSLIGLYTTDKQFIVMDPDSGIGVAGHPIGDQLRQNNGAAGTSWNPATAYVTWHVDGEDQAWYLSDGVNGWYRLMTTPAPETGLTWSPFASIGGGVKAVQSIEVSPGVHKLLCGPTSTGPILQRDLSASTDNGSMYSAYAVIGSAVLAEPGQIATVSFITTESVLVGTPLSIGVLLNEALPYYKGAFETLSSWANDPPSLPQSRSILGQRFYLAEAEDQGAVCRHMQIKVIFGQENAQNELLALTVFGSFLQET